MPYSLTWLPDVLRAAGLRVALVDGWQERGRGDLPTADVKGIVCHHTAGPRTGNMPSLATVRDGRPDLPGPLSQLGLGRDGTFYIIAAGKCNHAGKGEWQRIEDGNASFIGIEAENTGLANDYPWPAVQFAAYQRGVAAILRHLRLTADACCGHREYARPVGRKSDPTFDMDAFRAGVKALIETGLPLPPLIPAAEPPRPDGRPGRPTLRRESTGSHVRALQAMLGVEAVGVFGPRTEAAVRAFQREAGLVPDGIVGPVTWAQLDALGRPALTTG